MKHINLPIVVALSITVSACDISGSDKPAQRDVYTSLEDCVIDWGDTELCQREMKEAREHAEKMAKASGSIDGGFVPIFMGPTYYGDSRSVTHNGRKITPITTSSVRTANFTSLPSGNKSISYTAPNTRATNKSTSKIVGTSVTRGGIGSSASSSSSS